MKKVRPYQLYGESQLIRLRKEVEEIVKDWLNDWVSGSQHEMALESTIRQIATANLPPSNVRVASIDSDWCAVGNSEEFVHGLYRLMVNQQSAQMNGSGLGVMGVAIEKALADLGARVISGCNGMDAIITKVDKGALPKDVLVPGSGCLLMEFRFNNTATQLCLSRHVVECYLKNANLSAAVKVDTANAGEQLRLMSPKDAVGNQKIRVRLRLGDAELALESLGALQLGDVIKLDTRISERSEMVFPGANTKCFGYLGQVGGKYALRIDSVGEV